MPEPDGRIYYKGSTEVADAVGIRPDEIAHEVEENGLPAFKRGPKGRWMMLKKDAEGYLRTIQKRFLEEHARKAG